MHYTYYDKYDKPTRRTFQRLIILVISPNEADLSFGVEMRCDRSLKPQSIGLEDGKGQGSQIKGDNYQKWLVKTGELRTRSLKSIISFIH